MMKSSLVIHPKYLAISKRKFYLMVLSFVFLPDKLDYCQTLTPFENPPELLRIISLVAIIV